MIRRALTRVPQLLASAAIVLPLVATGPAHAQSLVDALSTAYQTNPTLKAARAQLRATNEGVAQELSNWRPRVELSGSAGQQRIRTDLGYGSSWQTTTPRDVSLSIVQPLYRGGRTLAGTSRAENEVQAQRAQLSATEQSVLLRGATAFMDVWRDTAVLDLNKSNEQVLMRQLEASQDRFRVGEITRTDVAQAESRLARATASRVASEGQLRASRAVYEEVIGEAPADLHVPPALSGLPASLDDAVAMARAANPSVKSAEFAEMAAKDSVRQVTGELYPTVSVAGTVSRIDEASTNNSETKRGSVVAQVTVPLYQAGFVSSRVREAKQVNSQRRVQVDETRRSTERQAVAAWEGLSSAQAQITSFESQVQAGEIALEGVRQEYLVGARTTLDVLNAEQELLDAQVSLVRAQRDEIVAGFQLLSAVGRLSATELGLAVEVYDPQGDYDAVRNSWFGLSAPSE